MDDLELRAALAREVFGLPNVHERGVLSRQLFYTDSSQPHPVPAYESTWEGMGLVVERMRELGWNFTLDAIRVSESWVTKNVWDAEFTFGIETIDDLGPPIGCGTAPTGPLAICLAAKAAMEATQ